MHPNIVLNRSPRSSPHLVRLNIDPHRHKPGSRPISIFVPNDGVAMRPSHVAADGNIEDWDLSPKGKRALFVARGDVFTAPIEKGPTRNLTNSSNAHDKRASWSPDGKQIAFISDMDGEEEIYLLDND